MRLLQRRNRETSPTEIVAVARVGRRTKDLVKRLQPGEIAIIDHEDLDRVAADGLVESGVAVVVNAAASISGRYPNQGPIRVVKAGIVLVDRVGPDLLDRVRDGETLRVVGGEVWRGDELLATGLLPDADEIEASMEHARATIGAELERFAENTLEYMRREAQPMFEPIVVPPLVTEFKGRHALVVVRGHDYKDDLRALRPYIRQYRPALIGVDGGADALLENGFKPDVIIGDLIRCPSGPCTSRPTSCTTSTPMAAHPGVTRSSNGESRTMSSLSRVRVKMSPCCWRGRQVRR